MRFFTSRVVHDKPPVEKFFNTSFLLAEYNTLVTALPLILGADPKISLACSMALNTALLLLLREVGKSRRVGSNAVSASVVRASSSICEGVTEIADNEVRNVMNGGDHVMSIIMRP